MNKERIEELAQTIERAPHVKVSEDANHYPLYVDRGHIRFDRLSVPASFSLGQYYVKQGDDGCDTIGCIAGFCTAMYHPTEVTKEDWTSLYVLGVARSLDIPNLVATYLCCPEFQSYENLYDEDDQDELNQDEFDYEEVEPEDAAQAVRNLRNIDYDHLASRAAGDDRGHYLMDILWRHVVQRYGLVEPFSQLKETT